MMKQKGESDEKLYPKQVSGPLGWSLGYRTL